MRRYDFYQTRWFSNAVKFANERHDVRNVLDHVATNDLVKFVVAEWIRQHAEIVKDVSIGTRI